MKGKTNASSDGFQRQILINGNSDSPIYGSDPPSFQAKEGQIYYQIQDGGSSESGDFNKLINRPQYNGQPMTNATNIPEVKTSIWDSKQDQITDIANIRTGAGLGMTAIQPSGYNPTAKTDQMTQAVGKDDNGKLWTTPGGGGGTGNFNDLTNRPSYNGIAMTNATNIPFVDSTNWNNAYSWVNSNGPSVKSHTTNTDIHVTSSQKTAWDGKYSKPSTGIPKSDLADDAVIGLVVSAIVNADTGRITSYSPDYETIASAVTNKKAVVARVIYEEGCIDYCLSCASADSDSLLFTYAGYISDEFTIDIKSFRIYNDDDPSSCNIEIKESHSPAKGFFSANRILATDSSGEFTDRVVDSSPTSGHSNYLISSGGVYTALSNKQDSLPNPTKDYYLHSNATNGALEWKAVNYNPNTSTAAMTQTVGVDGNGKLWTIPGGTTNFDALTNRPSYNGIVMTSSTKIPSVDSKNWTAAYSWVNSNGNSVVNHIANTSVHVNSTEKTTWNKKLGQSDIVNSISRTPSTSKIPSENCLYNELAKKVDVNNYNPNSATALMTQVVGVDINGKLWTEPTGGGGSKEFLVTFSYDDTEEKWKADKTYEQISAARADNYIILGKQGNLDYVYSGAQHIIVGSEGHYFTSFGGSDLAGTGKTKNVILGCGTIRIKTDNTIEVFGMGVPTTEQAELIQNKVQSINAGSSGLNEKYPSAQCVYNELVKKVDVNNYNPNSATVEMTQAVGVDANGKLWTTPSSGGTEDFNQLTNRPSYNGIVMTNATNIPFVDSANWNNKIDRNIGSTYSGQFLVVGSDGNVTTQPITFWDGSVEVIS